MYSSAIICNYIFFLDHKCKGTVFVNSFVCIFKCDNGTQILPLGSWYDPERADYNVIVIITDIIIIIITKATTAIKTKPTVTTNIKTITVTPFITIIIIIITDIIIIIVTITFKMCKEIYCIFIKYRKSDNPSINLYIKVRET